MLQLLFQVLLQISVNMDCYLPLTADDPQIGVVCQTGSRRGKGKLSGKAGCWEKGDQSSHEGWLVEEELACPKVLCIQVQRDNAAAVVRTCGWRQEVG